MYSTTDWIPIQSDQFSSMHVQTNHLVSFFSFFFLFFFLRRVFPCSALGSWLQPLYVSTTLVRVYRCHRASRDVGINRTFQTIFTFQSILIFPGLICTHHQLSRSFGPPRFQLYDKDDQESRIPCLTIFLLQPPLPLVSKSIVWGPPARNNFTLTHLTIFLVIIHFLTTRGYGSNTRQLFRNLTLLQS